MVVVTDLVSRGLFSAVRPIIVGSVPRPTSPVNGWGGRSERELRAVCVPKRRLTRKGDRSRPLQCPCFVLAIGKDRVDIHIYVYT